MYVYHDPKKYTEKRHKEVVIVYCECNWTPSHHQHPPLSYQVYKFDMLNLNLFGMLFLLYLWDSQLHTTLKKSLLLKKRKNR